MESNLNFGLKIKELIKSKKVSNTEAAKLLGYTLPGLGKILAKEDVSTEVLKKVCEAFNVDMAYFLAGNTYVSQRGRNFQSGEGNTLNDGGSHNVVGAKETSNENLLLKSENEGLKKQIALLTDMVDILKAAKGIQTKSGSSKENDDDVNKYIMANPVNNYRV